MSSSGKNPARISRKSRFPSVEARPTGTEAKAFGWNLYIIDHHFHRSAPAEWFHLIHFPDPQHWAETALGNPCMKFPKILILLLVSPLSSGAGFSADLFFGYNFNGDPS